MPQIHGGFKVDKTDFEKTSDGRIKQTDRGKYADGTKAVEERIISIHEARGYYRNMRVDDPAAIKLSKLLHSDYL